MKPITIIIPHYNSVKTLNKLLSTIPLYEDIQVIVVDDNSNEGLPEFEELKNVYSSVLFLKNTRGKKGAGACRNIGLENAKGKWVLFADSDDYFVDGFYNIVSKYFDSCFEVIFFQATSVNLLTGEKSIRHHLVNEVLTNYIKFKNHETELLLRYTIPYPVCKLIDRNFLNKNSIRFDEIIASNDKMFSTKVGSHMKRFFVSDEVIYCITLGKKNLLMNVSNKVFTQRFSTFIEYHNYLCGLLDSNDFKKLNIHGRYYIINSVKYGLGIKKTINTIIKLQQNKVKIMEKRFFNPLVIISKIIHHWKNYLLDKEHYHKK